MYTIQSNFTKGELDPQAVARIDLNAYYQGLEIARNVICIPQGGMKKRAGMNHVADAVNSTSSRLEVFSYSTDDNYLIEFYVSGVRVLNPDGTVADTVATPYSASDVAELDYIQSYDTIIIVHPNHEPRRIVRNNPTDFTISTLPLKNLPTNNFNDSSSPAGLPEIQEISFNGTWNNGDTFKLQFNGVQTDPIPYSASPNEAETATAIEKGLNVLPNIGGDGVTVVHLMGGTYQITFAANSSYEWDLISGTPEVVQAVGGQNISATRTQSGQTTFEESWSNTRGWPQTVTFHENRLWFGGSESLPSTVWGSNVNSYFDFRSYKARDDEAITATLDTDQRNAITGILSNRALQIFTTGQEFYVPDSPITPENISVRSQTNFGSKRVRPVTLSGSTLFIQRTGKSLNDFVYAESENANTTTSKSILAPHLIKNPIQLSIQRGAPDSDANYIYIVNDDGTVTVLNALPLENIAAFTRWETDGLIRSVSVVEERVFFCVERNGSVHIEVENDSLNMDSGEILTGSISIIGGLDRFNGLEVAIKTDGNVAPSQVVTGGLLDLGGTFSTVEFGLPFYPEMKTLPQNVNLQTGSALYKKKRIKRVALDLFQSNGIIVNEQRIPDKTIGVNQFDPPIPYSGITRKYLQGWSVTANITITQDTPYPFQVLSVGVEVAL